MKNKIKLQTAEQTDYVFSQPISFASCATISYPYEPKGFGVLDISSNRAGKARLKEITFSTFGDANKIVLGVSTIDQSKRLKKEDLYEFNKTNSFKTIFPKGRYQKENPLYRKTHYRKLK